MDQIQTQSLIAPPPVAGRLGRVVIVDRESRLIAHYRVTFRDLETGALIAESVWSPMRNGEPPPITVGDVVELIGEYRSSSIAVEIVRERIADPVADSA